MLPEPSHTRSIRSFLSRHSLQFPLSKSERHFTVISLWNALPSSVALCSSLASFRASLLTGHVFLWTLADSTLLIHCSYTECPVVLFFCHYRRASHDSLNILLLFGVTQKHKKKLETIKTFRARYPSSVNTRDKTERSTIFPFSRVLTAEDKLAETLCMFQAALGIFV